MGKKKSTVLMVLLTIVMVALCAITVFPSFAIPGTVKIWNPAVTQYDLGEDLGGGFYAYYYPTGVISETEYLELGEDGQETYTQYVKNDGTATGLYLNNDPVYGILDESEECEGGVSNVVVDEFEEVFEAAVAELTARFAAKGYADYRVSIVDDFAVRVELPSSEKTEVYTAAENAMQTFGWFAKMGGMTITLTGSEVSQLDDYELTEIINEVHFYKKNGMTGIRITFSEVGDEMINDFLYDIEEAAALTSASSSVEDPVLAFYVGDEAIFELDETKVDNGYIYEAIGGYEVFLPVGEEEEADFARTLVILLNSALNNAEGFDIEFTTLTNSDLRTYGTVFGEATMLMLYIALFAVIVALIAFSVVKMGRFGVVSGYATVSYLIVTGLCFAFISNTSYAITLGTVLVFALGLALINALNAYVYNAIKAEFALGKTVESSVKGGYKKTLWNVVDVYAVLLLGALALLIGAAGLQTFATQALICIVTAAFCNLLWTRVINYVFLSASKNKYKYFRFVREDNDDE